MAQLTDEQALALQNPAPTLEQVQASQIAVITADYQSAIAQPVSYTTVGGMTKTFQADAGSQDVLLQAIAGYNLVGDVPSGFYWLATDNTHVPFTLADLKGMYTVMLAQGWAAFQTRTTLKDEINAVAITATVTQAQAIAAVQAIVWP
jgi:hypothetical protein